MLQIDCFFYLFAVISCNTNLLFLFVYYSFTNVVCLGPYIKRETGNWFLLIIRLQYFMSLSTS